MSRIDDGGPAFPNVPVNSETPERYAGMSMLGWFAGKAMAAQVAGQCEALVKQAKRKGARQVLEQLALSSYAIARAMLAERAKARGGQSDG